LVTLTNYKSKLIWILVILILLAFGDNGILAQSKIESFYKTALDDFCYITSYPFNMTDKERVKLLGFSALTMGLIFYFDELVNEKLITEENKFKSRVCHNISQIAYEYGYSDERVFYLFGGLSSAMLFGSLISENEKLLKTTGLIVESFAFSSLIVAAGKIIVVRERPYSDSNPLNFNLFSFKTDRASLSMPSGHTSSAFAMMTVIAKQYDYWWIKVPAYIFAVAAGLQRIESRNHWLSDVIVGGTIGYFVGGKLVEKHKEETDNRSCITNFRFSQKGISMTFYF
jgi:membrane-associated phospholipid phosphatase